MATFINVEVDFFIHLLKKMGSAHLNAGKTSKYWRPPMWKQKALHLSFKTYNLEDVQHPLCKQSAVCLCLSKSFNSATETNASCQVVLLWKPQRARQQESSPLFALKLTLALDRGEQVQSVNLFGVQYLTVPPVVC